MKRNNKESIEQYVYEEIKTAIFNRKIPINMQLSEEQLAEAFAVSRTPIRSVLKQLQYEKLIQILPNKGAFINLPSSKEIEEVFQIRIIMETEAVKIACRTASEQELNDLEELTRREESLYKQGEYGKAVQLTSDFHQGIINLTGNELLSNYSRELINLTNVYLAYHDHADVESPLCPVEHRNIIQAIMKRDEAEAVRILGEHFQTVKKHLGSNDDELEVNFSSIFKPLPK